MMYNRPTLIALSFLAAAFPCMGDTFTLNDGTIIEGTIVSQDVSAYVLDVHVTKTIKDTHTLLKADVAKVTRERPDLKEFEVIEKLVPTPDLLTGEEYFTRVASVENFLKAHADSSKAGLADAILVTLKQESAAVAKGGVKLNGGMIEPSDFKANAYELDARSQEAKIRRLIEARELLAALRAFSEFDRDFRTTLSYGVLTPLIKQAIQFRVAESKELLSTLDQRVKERQLGLERMSLADRPVTDNAIKQEIEDMDAKFAAEKNAKITWVTTSPFHKPSLEEALRFGEAEYTRINTVQTPLGADGGKSFRDAWRAIHSSEDAAAVAAAIAAAQTAMVAPAYLAILQEAAKAK